MTPKQNGLRITLESSYLVLIFSLGFMQPTVEVSGIALTATELIFVLTAAIWFLALVFRKVRLRFDRIYIFFVMYAIGLLISAAFSENPGVSLIKYLGEVYLIGLALMTFNLVDSPRMLKRAVIAWIAATFITVIIGIVTVTLFYLGISNTLTEFSLTHYGSLPPGNYPRIASTFIYPSMLCNYLTVSIMMLLGAKKLEWIGTKLFIALSAGIAVTIGYTLTPGIGGVLLAVSVWIWFEFNGREKAILSRLALAGGIIAASLFLLVSTFTLINTQTSPYFYVLAGHRIDPTQRLLTWQAAFQTFMEHPFLGKGLGLGVAGVYFMPPSGQMQLLTDAHNVFLSVAGQTGIVGLIPLLLILAAVIFRLRLSDININERSIMLRSLGIAFASAFLYQGLVGSFEDARHLWVLIGLILAIGKFEELLEVRSRSSEV